MNKLKIEKESRKIYDVEYTAKPVILLKGIGKYCKCGCGKHVFGNKKKEFFNSSCRRRYYERSHPESKYARQKNTMIGLHAFINLHKNENKNPYRIMKVYLKKGIIEEVKITPESKDLWALLDKINQFRDISKPLMELTA